MAKKSTPVVTKTGVTIETCYCRKCMNTLPAGEFFDSSDNGLIDSNGKFSVCKNCIQDIYDTLYAENQSMEKTIHKMCIVLNLKFSNEAVDAAKKHIQTLIDNGKNTKAVFSIYKMKIMATNTSMEKNIAQDDGYEDVGTIFVSEIDDPKKLPIPTSVLDFWGRDIPRDDIEYLEHEYANFKQTHSTETYAEIVLLKRVCYTLLDIKLARVNNDDTVKLVKELQELMKSLNVSPDKTSSNSANAKDIDAFGLWIQDIEKEEPAQWLLTDPRGDIYRDVGNVEEYFQKYIVRPLKNLITGSKDFNVDDDEVESEFTEEEVASVFGEEDE